MLGPVGQVFEVSGHPHGPPLSPNCGFIVGHSKPCRPCDGMDGINSTLDVNSCKFTQMPMRLVSAAMVAGAGWHGKQAHHGTVQDANGVGLHHDGAEPPSFMPLGPPLGWKA